MKKWFLCLAAVMMIATNVGCDKATVTIQSEASASPSSAAPVVSPVISLPALPSVSSVQSANTSPAKLKSYSLEDIKRELAKQGITEIQESPNKQYISYLEHVGEKNDYTVSVHIWKVGEDKPQQTGPAEYDMVGDVWWSPTSDYIFEDSGTFVTRGGALLSVEGLHEIVSLSYNHKIYFSPDGKNIVFYRGNNSISSVQEYYIDPGNATDVVVYNIASGKEETILQGAEAYDYKTYGWLDSSTISYDKNQYRVIDGELHIDRTRFKFDLKTKKSLEDELVP